MFMTRANIWNELRRVNVGWVALALVCLVTVMWLAACGEAPTWPYTPEEQEQVWEECRTMTSDELTVAGGP